MNGRVVGLRPHLGVVFRLPFYQRIRANLADDSVRMVDVHRAVILWNGVETVVAVLAMGQHPLLGTALLAAHDLVIRFEDGAALSVQPFWEAGADEDAL